MTLWLQLEFYHACKKGEKVPKPEFCEVEEDYLSLFSSQKQLVSGAQGWVLISAGNFWEKMIAPLGGNAVWPQAMAYYMALGVYSPPSDILAALFSTEVFTKSHKPSWCIPYFAPWSPLFGPGEFSLKGVAKNGLKMYMCCFASKLCKTHAIFFREHPPCLLVLSEGTGGVKQGVPSLTTPQLFVKMSMINCNDLLFPMIYYGYYGNVFLRHLRILPL